MAWNDISEEERAELYRRYKNHESIIALSEETGIYPPTLERNLRAWKQKQVEAAAVPSPAVEKVVKKPEHPDYADIFYLLKQRSWSIGELANHFDCAPAKIHHALDAMKLEGYQIFADSDRAYFNSVARPKQQVEFPRTLADEEGMDVVFATFSDPHAGSLYAQPTALNKFIQIATEEYGARHIFVPGDITTGVNGYRGQEYDLVPTLQGCGKNYSAVVEGEVWLADHYIPHIPGVKYYLLSGNHDGFSLTNTGVDPVPMLCNRRDDMVYLGYDIADIPLTDKVDIRLYHPGSGPAYALSYRLQKALEQLAFEELSRAAVDGDNPKLRMILAGHLHIEVKFQRGPMIAAHVGCFEGATDFMKRKGLYPTIGGAVLRARLTDGGMIQRIEYTFIPFTEIENDWQNWPVPERSMGVRGPDHIDAIFKA